MIFSNAIDLTETFWKEKQLCKEARALMEFKPAHFRAQSNYHCNTAIIATGTRLYTSNNNTNVNWEIFAFS